MTDASASAQRVSRFWPFPRVYYGWAIVWSGLIVSVAQAPVYGPVVSLFVKPIADETGWSRASISFAFTLGSIVGTFAGAPVGAVLDRFGARGVVSGSGLVVAGSLLGLSLMQEQWQLWILLAAGRGMAMSGIQMGTMVSVANWFVRKRGRATSIPSFGVRAGQAIVPLLILPVIVTYGWREAYGALSVVALILIVVPAWIYLRRRPEDHGLLPDGESGGPYLNGGKPRELPTEVQWTLREALRTTAFWLLIVVTASGMFGQTAANLHAVPNFLDKGMRDALAFTIPAVFAGISAVSTFGWGYLMERVSARIVMVMVAVLNVSGMLLLIWAVSYPAAFAYGVLAGLAGGGFLVAQRLMWANYFGRSSVGSIRGVASMFIGVVGPMGPLVAGWIFDTYGSYTVAFAIAAVIFGIGLVAMLFAPPPRKPTLTTPA